MKPTFIYRLGARIKDLALTRPGDYITGLSFYGKPFGVQFLKLSVAILEENGFAVRPDGGELMTDVFTRDPYVEPNSGMQLSFPEGHVSVWYPDRDYWDRWYEADRSNKTKTDVSAQLVFFARAIVQEDIS